MSELNTFKDVVTFTGLKPAFIRRCLRELRSILDDYITQGGNGRLLFNQSALVIFDKIKQEKERGLSLPKIKEGLLTSLSQKHDKGQQGLTTTEQQIVVNDQENKEKGDKEAVVKLLTRLQDTQEELNKEKMAKKEAEQQLQLIKNNLKYLPAGSDPMRARKAISLMEKLKATTKAKLLVRNKKVDNIWEELEETLFGKVED